MDNVTGIVIVVVVLAAIFLVVALNFRKVEGGVDTPLVKGRFKGTNEEKENLSGDAKVSKVKGKNIKIGDVIGSRTDEKISGSAEVSNIEADKDIKIGDVIGVDSSDREKK